MSQREQVRLQCTYESILWLLWWSHCSWQTVPGGQSVDSETSLPCLSRDALNH